MVSFREATSKWGKRQSRPYLGQIGGILQLPNPVSPPVQLACFGRRRWRQDDQVLEHTHRGVLELGGHRIAGLCTAVEQEREGTSEFSWVHAESADSVEVSVNGEDRGAHGAYVEGVVPGSESRWVYRGLGCWR
ncbi:unnamed protein product [Linum tenue]|uniref:Uncharacterized protein n=1 Tax=Linum tenue TaxID=586396 RepID=A0AAV0KMT2_9ROSI|nr:unnamed protein product [Linum tenue]